MLIVSPISRNRYPETAGETRCGRFRIAREEIFGPVMSVMSWNDYDDMLEKVNDVEYGLTAAIVTNDLAKAMETAERVEAGYVWINSSGRYIGAPMAAGSRAELAKRNASTKSSAIRRSKTSTFDGDADAKAK